MKAEWVSISETDGDVTLHSRKLYARGNGFEREAVDSYEEFHVSRELCNVSDEVARTNEFYKLKSYVKDSIGVDYNKRVLYTPSGEQFIRWLIQEKTGYDSKDWDGLTQERYIKRNAPAQSHLPWTLCPIEKRYIYEFEWMAENDVLFHYPDGAEPCDTVRQIREDAEQFVNDVVNDVINNQLSWYSEEDETHYIYTLELFNVETRETWWYIGQSRALKNRLTKHIRRPPSPYKTSNKPFYVTGLHDVESSGYQSKDEAVRREHEKSFELAIEHGSTNVLGGK